MLIDLSLAIALDDPVVGKANMDQHSFMSAGHIGTHLDTYLQRPIPTEFHRRRGRLVDASAHRGADIGFEVLAGRSPEPGDFVIFHTGQLQQHRYGTREYFAQHPQLSWALIDHLLACGVSFIGIDAAGVRRGDEHSQADRRAEAKGTYIIENLDNTGALLAAAGAQPFEVFTGWTGLRGFSGLSCRVIAEVEAAHG